MLSIIFPWTLSARFAGREFAQDEKLQPVRLELARETPENKELACKGDEAFPTRNPHPLTNQFLSICRAAFEGTKRSTVEGQHGARDAVAEGRLHQIHKLINFVYIIDYSN